jgi:hypothetical protein
VIDGRLFRGVSSFCPRPMPRALFQGDGVEPREGGALVEQHQDITEQAGVGLGDQQFGVGAADHPLEVAPGQAVVVEATVFQFDQAGQVVEGGGA